jgi:hypothetical protein
VPHILFDGSIEILFDAFSVEYVAAFGLDCVLSNVIANPADRCLAGFGHELGCIGLASQDKIGMTGHLPHASKPATNVRDKTKKRKKITDKLKILE